jgi:Ca2+-binding RTX toxin-like protein
MKGGLGSDKYYVDNIGDIIVENANEGTDIVTASINYTLGDNLENLSLSNTAPLNLNATGNSKNNVIDGNSYTNVIDAGAGNDTVKAWSGNDTIYGNLGDDKLYGGNGNDTIDGGLGIDTLYGEAGNDIYIINENDTIIENLNEGTDTVNASITYTLVDNVENLNLTGTTAINGTGNGQNNIINGNNSANIIDGGLGADVMKGGLGNDKYYVDNIGDIIVENANEGTDTVTASINYTLGDNLENLSLSNTGALNLNATGNSKNNVIDGNSYTNVIDAGAGNDTVKAWSGNDTIYGNLGDDNIDGGNGNDTITGGLGNDTLLGGNGADTYKFARGDGQDTVNNYDTDALSINQDIIEFYQNISSNQLWFTKNGNNLDISIIGTTDKMSIKDWYTNASNQVDKFKSSDGKELINADVDKLVQAMAAFTPPSMGQTTLPSNYQSSLNTTIAANWH